MGGWLRSRGAFSPALDGMTGSFYETFGCLFGALEPASRDGTTVPSTVFVGCSPTYSMPTDHSGTAEYVSGQCFVPTNWDMTSDFRAIIWWAQASAETSGEQFVWNLQHNFASEGDLLGSYVEVGGTTTLGADGTVQYTIYHQEFALPYGNVLGTAQRGGGLNFKLHRKIIGTTGEALLMGVQFGYWGTSFDGGEVSGTLNSKLLLASRM